MKFGIRTAMLASLMLGLVAVPIELAAEEVATDQARYEELFDTAISCARAENFDCVRVHSGRLSSNEFVYSPRYEVYLLEAILHKADDQSELARDRSALFLLSILVDAGQVDCDLDQFTKRIGSAHAQELYSDICAEYYLSYYDDQNEQKSRRLFNLLDLYVEFVG